MWHDIINTSINSHRTNNYRACTAEELTDILKTLTIISAIVYCQKKGSPDIRNQLISSGIPVIPITKCLISKRKRRTELANEYQTLHQDVQLELKSLRIVFEHQDNLPAVLPSFVQTGKRYLNRKGGRRKEYWWTEARKMLFRLTRRLQRRGWVKLVLIVLLCVTWDLFLVACKPMSTILLPPPRLI